jgi:hypothetical protein
MNCQSCRIEIEELLMGESLSKESRTHLEDCSACGAFYYERMSLRKLVGSLEHVSAPPDFDFRLRARLAASGSVGNHRFSLKSLISSGPALSLAASFALLVGAAVIYNHFKSGSSSTNQPSMIAHQSPERNSEAAKGSSSSVTAASGTLPAISELQKNDGASPAVVPVSVNNSHQRLVLGSKRTLRQPRQLERGSAQIVTNDIASRSAPRITPANGSQAIATSSQLVELPVRSSSQAMRVLVDDKSGGKRSLTLEPVIFGSQDFTGRTSSRVPMSQGIW